MAFISNSFLNHIQLNRKVEFGISCFLIFAMFAASSLDLSRPFWLDEVVSLFQVQDSNFIRGISSETHPPTFYLLLVLAQKFLPNTETGLRLFSLGFSFLTVVALIGISHLRLKITPLPALLFLACPMTVFQSQNLRPYTLLALLSTLVSLFAARILFCRNADIRTSYAVCFLITLIGLLTHYWFVFLPTGLFCAAFLTAASQSRVKALFYCFLLSGLTFLALHGVTFYSHLGIEGAYYAAKIGLTTTLRESVEFLPAGKGKYIFTILLLLSIYRSRQNLKNIHALFSESEPAFYFLSGSIAFLFPIVLWCIKPILVMKTVMILFPPVCLGVGYFVAKSLSPKELIGGMLMLTIGSFSFVIRNPISRGWPQTEMLIGIINQSAQSSPIVACELSFATTEYYLSRNHPKLVAQLVPLPSTVSSHRAWTASDSEVQSGKFENELSDLASNKRLVVLFSEKDRLCQQLTDRLRNDNFFEEELYSGYGDRFQKILVFTRRVEGVEA